MISGSLRGQAYEKLKSFLVNPGYFSLLVLGPRGTGKKFLVQKAFEEMQGRYMTMNCINFVSSEEVGATESEVQKWFERSEGGVLVVNDIERLSAVQQNILFKMLSTTDGRLGAPDNKVFVRVVFTSSEDPKLLRHESESYLKGVFWDRISQLVVNLPSFHEDSSTVIRDFRDTWSKMNFNKLRDDFVSSYPKNDKLHEFLQDRTDLLEGGFRDLDRLAAMYFNYRVFLYGEQDQFNEAKERQVFDAVKEDFLLTRLERSQFDSLKRYEFRVGKTYAEIQEEFKVQLRSWAKEQYGTYDKASKKLKMSSSTFRSWKKVK